uniref:UTP4 small subunit processome component n=1 Tax=Monodelphis domestica TaxID=13616 RepID=A0A5F8HK92_MONDO
MGEFKVHRVRFFNYVPVGIRCVAYNHQSNRLAVSRVDGTVEIYNLAANSFQEKFFPGHEGRATEALCWAKGQRLFSAGLNGDIIEYDLEKMSVKYSVDGFGGPIWSMAADPSGSYLAIGCEDGSVKLFQVSPDKIQLERTLERQKGRILSLSWHPSGTHIAVGSIDYIAVLDAKSGSTTQKMLMDKRHPGSQRRRCVVWGVAFLSDGTVVSTDSAGMVQFWDSETGTLVQTHPLTSSDVLSIAVAEKEDSLVVGTAEGTIFHFQLIPSRSDGKQSQWVRTKPFQHHTHDVRSVAHSPTALISGGVDAHLVIRPLMEKVEVKNYDAALRKITFPHRRLISCAKKMQLLLFQFPQRLELWRLGATDAAGTSEAISLLAVSPDGNWLAAAGMSSGVSIYNLKHLKPHCMVPAYNFPVTALAIAPNTNNLVIAHSDQQVFEFSIPQKQYTDWSRKVQKHGLHYLWLERDTPITHITFHPKRPTHILLHDTYMFCIIDKSMPLPDDKTPLFNQLSLREASENVRRRHAHAFKISKKFQPLLFMDLLDEGTLVAVERPLEDIIAQLPPPIKRKKFGT